MNGYDLDIRNGINMPARVGRDSEGLTEDLHWCITCFRWYNLIYLQRW